MILNKEEGDIGIDDDYDSEEDLEDGLIDREILLSENYSIDEEMLSEDESNDDNKVKKPDNLLET